MSDDRFYYDLDDLNTWLAVNVMEYTRKGGWWCDCHCVCRIAISNWDPLANDAQAMLVMSKMVERGWRVSIAYNPDDCWNGYYTKDGIVQWRKNRLHARTIMCITAKAAIEEEREFNKIHSCDKVPENAWGGRWVEYGDAFALEWRRDGGCVSVAYIGSVFCPFCGEKL
jgi:hypothetical protein